MVPTRHERYEHPPQTEAHCRLRLIRTSLISLVIQLALLLGMAVRWHIASWAVCAATLPSLVIVTLMLGPMATQDPETDIDIPSQDSAICEPRREPAARGASDSLVEHIRSLFAAEKSAEDTVTALADTALALTGAQWAWVRDFGCGGDLTRRAEGAPSGWDENRHLIHAIDLSCGQVFLSAKADNIPDTAALKPVDENGKPVSLPARSILTLPLLTDLGVEGFIVVASVRPEAFGQEHVESLSALAEFGALALSRVALTESNTMLKVERAEALDKLLESEQRFRTTLGAVRDGMIIRARDGSIISSNPSASRILGFPPHQFFTGDDTGEWQIVDENRVEFPLDRMPDRLAIASGQQQVEKTIGIERADGTVTWLRVSAGPVFLVAETEAYASVITFSDISEQKVSYDANARLAAIVDSSQDAIMCATLDGIVVSWNPGAQKLFGYTPDEAIGLVSPVLMPPNDRKSFKGVVARLLNGEGMECVECIRFRKDGVPVHVSMTYSLARNPSGEPIALAAIARDVTDRVRYEEQIKSQLDHINEINEELQVKQDELVTANERLATLATMDGLTTLKNHRFFQERLHEEVQRSQRYGGALSLFILDVDDFKQYNDTHGHPAGDEVLREVGKLLVSNCRTSDIVSRYGGEEFVVILPQTPAEGAIVIAERCRKVIEEHAWPLRPITASFGVSTLVEDIRTAAELIGAGDNAMYISKRSGKNRVTHASKLAHLSRPRKKPSDKAA